MSTILSSALRANLNSASLLNTQMSKTQERVSTGRAVNSASDDAYAYFTESKLRRTSSELDFLHQAMDRGLKTIDAAVSGLNTMKDLAERASSLVQSAKETSDRWERDGYRAQFADLISNMENIAKSAEYRGINLLGDASNQLSLELSADSANTLTINAASDDSIDNFTDLDGTAFGFDTAAMAIGIADTLANTTGANTAAINASDKIVDTLGYSAGDTITLKHHFSDGTSTTDTETFVYTIDANSTVQNMIDQVNGSGMFRASLNNTGKVVFETVGLVDGNTGAATENYFSVTESNNAATIQIAGGTTETFAAAGGSASYFSSDAMLDALETILDNFDTTLMNREGVLSNYKVIAQSHANMMENMISLLNEGADNLVMADIEKESVTLQVLQTRQQLAITTLSMATQAEQNIMRLF